MSRETEKGHEGEPTVEKPGDSAEDPKKAKNKAAAEAGVKGFFDENGHEITEEYVTGNYGDAIQNRDNLRALLEAADAKVAGLKSALEMGGVTEGGLNDLEKQAQHELWKKQAEPIVELSSDGKILIKKPEKPYVESAEVNDQRFFVAWYDDLSKDYELQLADMPYEMAWGTDRDEDVVNGENISISRRPEEAKKVFDFAKELFKNEYKTKSDYKKIYRAIAEFAKKLPFETEKAEDLKLEGEIGSSYDNVTNTASEDVKNTSGGEAAYNALDEEIRMEMTPYDHDAIMATHSGEEAAEAVKKWREKNRKRQIGFEKMQRKKGNKKGL